MSRAPATTRAWDHGGTRRSRRRHPTNVTGVVGVEESHRWRCPVIMKTAPDYVAYTCGRCGAIGVVALGESLSKLLGWAFRSGTAKGMALVDRIAPLHLANEATLVAPLNQQEQRTLTELLRKLLRASERQQPTPPPSGRGGRHRSHAPRITKK
jgi:hypothetical protein